MGLAASQARLLTITSRKSDAEFQSMRYSHDKIALSRSMTDISTEYQNSLNQTKLVYDFYGNGDTNTQLSYGLMMTPSIMNGYMPMITTNTSGRVVLNNQYAAAARAAGIPVEGLGCLPSEDVRNKFIQGLADSGLISQVVADNCMGIHYSQEIGMGTKDLVSVKTEKMNITELLEHLGDTTIDMGLTDPKHAGATIKLYKDAVDQGNASGQLSLKELLTNDYSFVVLSSASRDMDGNGKKEGEKQDVPWNAIYAQNIQDKTFESLSAMSNWQGWDDMMDAFENALNTTDPGVKAALDYARAETNKLIRYYNEADPSSKNDDWGANCKSYTYYDNWQTDTNNLGKIKEDVYNLKSWSGQKEWPSETQTILGGNGDGFGFYWEQTGHDYPSDYGSVENALKNKAGNYIGYVGFRNMGGSLGYDGTEKGGSNHKSGLAISVSNIMKAYLTFFIEKMEGMNSQYKVDGGGVTINGLTPRRAKGLGNYHLYNKNASGDRTVNDSQLVDLNTTYEFDVVTHIDVNSDHAMISGFYDALFNQICSRGWSENSNIDDNEYLAQMYQNGKYFLATCSDDGYYNAGNYSTNTYIREVTDNDAIAKAEAKYNTEKLKINQKEEILDLKMKNLDTEISSLTTEYDTIKSVISKQIEKSFKRYDA